MFPNIPIEGQAPVIWSQIKLIWRQAKLTERKQYRPD